ncbi:MAG: LptF/LptG family permease [Lentisphaeraceae bacterium]|nr:LptF/LptG family permease [Lentisphaeraceae bacterium]
MKILNNYVSKNILIVFAASIVVMTFIMMAGQLLKMLELLSSGISLGAFGKVFMFVLPEVMAFSIPIAMLIAVILVYSRMSAENEVTALRASGISLWQITAPGLILSFILSLSCLYLQLFVKPHCKFYLTNAKQNLALENPSAILRPGATVQLGDLSITIGDRDGEKISRVSIIIPESETKINSIYGKTGFIKVDESGKKINLHLTDVLVRGVEFSPEGTVETSPMTKKTGIYPIDIGQQINEKRLTKKKKFLDFNGTLGRIQVMSERGEDGEVNELLFRLNQNIVMALSPFAFLMVAMPFGFRSARSETSVGLVLSLLVVMVYFSVVMLMRNFDKYSFAHILVWLPNIAFVAYGLYAMKKITRT